MMLAAAKCSELVLEVDGPDEQAATDALMALFAEGFGEELGD